MIADLKGLDCCGNILKALACDREANELHCADASYVFYCAEVRCLVTPHLLALQNGFVPDTALLKIGE